MSDFKVEETSTICTFNGLAFCREEKAHSITWSNEGSVYWFFQADAGFHVAGKAGWRKYKYTTTPPLRKFLSSDFCELPEIEKAYQENLKVAHNYAN